MIDLKHGFAGGLAGIAVDICFYPLQTIKTRLMASTKIQNLTAIPESKFKGFSCQMIISFPYSFSFFCVYQLIRTKFNSQQIIFRNAIASICAEIVANVIRNPLEIIKQQIMVNRTKQIYSSFRSIYQSKGIKGYSIGFKPTLIRDIVFSAIQLPLFQYIRTHYQFHSNQIINSAISGSMAAIVAGFVSCPLDVLKTRLMTQKMEQKSLTTLNVVQSVIQQEGLVGFFKGVTFRCSILAFGGIIYFGSLQQFRQLIGLH